ncbi:hypothetical protein OKW29_001914 [Paraburkholderia sp. CI3]
MAGMILTSRPFASGIPRIMRVTPSVIFVWALHLDAEI